MPFMVIFRRSDGTSGFEQADAIDEAALFVERLRNNDGIEDDIRIYRMEEISFAFRPYYKVELGMPDLQVGGPPPMNVVPVSRSGPDEPGPAVDIDLADPVPVQVDAPVGPEPEGDDGANGRRGLFGR